MIAVLGLSLWLALSAWAGELVPPSILECPTPLYPAGVDAGPQRVSALLRVDEQGNVVRVQDLQGLPEFVSLVEPVAAACRFTPATEDGVPITVDQPFAWDWPAPVDNVVGQVITRGDRVGVRGASVELVRGTVDAQGEVLRTIETDDDGRFAFRNVAPGPLVLRVRAAGFRIPELGLDAPAEPTDVLELELWAFRERSTSDELVAVYDPRAPGPTRRVLEAEAIRAVPGSLGDPVRALLTQPGFARAPFEAGWLIVRGGDPDDTGLYLDGVRIPLLYHMGGFTSIVHPELTESVEYWAGAQPARLQGTSGAVNVIPRELGDRARAVAGVNVAWAHGFLEAPTRFGTVALAARRSYLDGVLALFLGAESASIAPKFADFQGTLQIGDARITGLWLGDNLEVPSLDGGTLEVTQVGAQLQGMIPIDTGRGQLTIRPWIARHGRGLKAFELSGAQVDEQALIERFPGLRIGWQSERTADLRIDTGVEAEYRSWLLLLDTRTFEAPGGRVDPWIQTAMGDRVQIETGIRLDTLWVREQLPRAGISPRSAVRAHLTDNWSIHGEVGRFHGIPEVLLIAGLPEGAYLPLERSDLISGGFRGRVNAWTLEGDVYSRRLANLASIETDGTLTQLVGRVRGFETQVAWRPEPVAVSLLYQYGHSERLGEPGSDPQPALIDQPHRLQLLVVSNLPRDWTLSSRFRYGSGFPRFTDEFTGLPYPSEALDLLTQQTVTLDDPLAERLPPFHSLDIKVLKEVQLRKWRLDFWLDVQNIYNRRVVEPFLTGFPESAQTYGFGLPVLPIFGIEGVWWPRREATPPPSTGG